MVTAHPWLRSAVGVLPVPGHDPKFAPPSAGVRIGETLNRLLGLSLVTVDSRTEFRRSAKNMTSAERAALLDEFIVVDDLRGCTVLVVDDAYHTGYTMAGVVKAARAAGAVTVLGIVPVRVMRLDVEPSKARVLDVE
ncbi:MAG TPA: phosphoribosyltransferase [Actinophytocola sp.]|uniref:phosphoribosyltransferase n=1 Tax=Actinophytocola sp. TaxID=1872138 RepID=UPI002DFF5C3A|nr:phosphoribosyltransferase [Actinophytocola sp.]